METHAARQRLSVLVGTAGHVDHGKTALVRALTGIDCDRWIEEKERGITIDLGFAHWENESIQIGFVDVPGHHRFLHNALAGLGGIRIALLVVAADEGIKPQTREHLAILTLLGIPRLVVALTKIDRVDLELAEIAAFEVGDLLVATPYRGTEIVPVSSTSGEGIERLRDTLVAAARAVGESGRDAAPARLPIDRAFVLQGQGVVVTGTLVSGVVATGEELALVPGSTTARVRSIQVHGIERARARAGERTALRLAGVEVSEVERGLELVGAGGPRATSRLLARLTLLAEAPKLPRRGEMRVHLFASERLATFRLLGAPSLAPGGSAVVELSVSPPIVAARGDRWIARRPSPAATWGGGEILDPAWRPTSAAALVDALRDLAGSDADAAVGYVRRTREAGATAAELAPLWGRRAEAIEPWLARAAGDGTLVAAAIDGARRYVAAGTAAAIERRARALLSTYFAREPLSAGMPKAELVKRLLPAAARSLAPFYLAWLERLRVLEVESDLVRPPGRRAELGRDESHLARELVAAYVAAGFDAPSPAEVARRVAAKAEIVEGVVKFLIGRGDLVRLPDGLILARATVDRVAEELLATGWERFSVPQFKDRFGLTRKWAIPLLEHLDGRGLTRRQGDERQIRRTPVS